MLNENQLAAVEFKDGPCLCLAGPGSGKTTVLVERIISLIKKGIAPSSILVITFTKDAAKEMKDRFIKKSPSDTGVVFGTFHSVFFQILKKSNKYHNFTLLNENKKNNLLFECLKILGIKEISGDYLVNLKKEISYYQNTGKLDSTIEDDSKKEEFFRILSTYKERKLKAKVLDFDDLLVLTKEVLKEDVNTLKYWQNRFSYFLVDEFQDINDVQFIVLKLLVENNPCGSENIFVVGDDDQSIYGFRGANPKVMLNFPQEFKDTTTIFLDTNYRSKKAVVMSSKKLIDVNENRYFKDYKAFNNDLGLIRYLEFKDEIEEGEVLSKLLYEDSMNTLKTVGVLYRNRNRKSLLYALVKKLDFPVFSDDIVEDFKSSDVTKDILAYINLSKGNYKRKDILKVMNKPKRELLRGGLFRENITLKEWRDYYPKETKAYIQIDKMIEKLSLLKNLSPFSGINFILKGLGYEEYLKSLKDENKTEYDNRMSDLAVLLAYSKDFTDMRDFLKDILREKHNEVRKKEDENISFYTFHGSKGLEFDKVYILDAIEGITPSANAKTPDLMEEERRMFYVAMTRAKEEVVFCVPKKISGEDVNPSRFLMESGCDMV